MNQRFHKSILKNGVTVLTESVDFVRSCAIGVFIQAGTRDENPENNGIAHFIEHMIFKGTKNRNAFGIVDEIESRGGSLNAYTSKEITSVYARVLETESDSVLSVFSDILMNSLFSDEDILLEKSVVQEELDETEDTPHELAHDSFVSMMFPNHPLGFNILGTKETIQEFDAQKIQSFIKENYSGNRVIIGATGAINHEEFLKSVQKYFADFPDMQTQRNTLSISQPETQSKSLERDINQTHFLMGRQSYSYMFEKRYPYLILNAVLTAGMSSRLFQNVREKYGFAYNIYSYVDMFREGGLFGAYVGTDKDRVDDMKDIIWKEFRKIKKNSISTRELDKVKKQYEGNAIIGLESMYNRLEKMCRYEFQYGEFLSFDTILDNIHSVSVKDIHDVAEDLFDESRFHSFILKPAEK